MQKITLAAARKNAGYTQETLAEKMGVSRDLIAKIETGKAELRPIHLYAYCYITGFHAEDFILPRESTK